MPDETPITTGVDSPDTPESPKTSERFSESEKGKVLIKEALDELKIDIESERAKTLIEAVDAQFEAKRGEILHAWQEARHELATKIAGQATEQVTGALTEAPTDAQIIDALKKVIEEEIVEGELKVGDLKTLTREPLMKLEEERPGALLFAFTTWGDKYAHVKVEDFEPYKNPAPGTEVEIHFRGNDQAYWKIGAGDILPASVQCVTITDDRGNARTGARRDSPRNGFYDENGYIRIFNNYKIKIEPAERAQEIKPKTQPNDDELQAAEEEQVALAGTTRTVRSGPRSTPRARIPGRERRLRETRPITEWLNQDWRTAGYEASQYYAARLGVRVDPAVIFAIIKHESGFKPGIPNASGSRALGLGQFMPDTWERFVEQNSGLIADISPNNPNPKRTDPILSIYATTWYTAKNAKGFGIKEVTKANAKEVYLMHHNGAGGYRTYKKYRELMAQERPEKEAASKAGFRVPGEPGTYYRNRFGTNTARYARWLEDFSGPVQQTAIRYDRELRDSASA